MLWLSRVGGKDGKSGLCVAGKGSVIVITATHIFIRNLLVHGLGDLREIHVDEHLKACRHCTYADYARELVFRMPSTIDVS